MEKHFPEIQADTCLDIAKYAAVQNSKQLRKPVLREDHGLFFDKINIPGPYTSFFEKRINAQSLLRILKILKSTQGYFEVATVLALPTGKLFKHVFKVPMYFGKGVNTNGSTWNDFIHLFNEKKTISEYPEQERYSIWSIGFEKVAKDFVKSLTE